MRRQEYHLYLLSRLEQERAEPQCTIELFRVEAGNPAVGYERQPRAQQRPRLLTQRLEDITEEENTLKRHFRSVAA